MKNPKISVVMSVYSEPLSWLNESINSILNQTFKDFQLIIVNDNPKREELVQFLAKCKRSDTRVKLIKNRSNLGLATSLNKGLLKATGKYIARMDADDISFPERFDLQYNFLETNKDVFLVGAGAEYIDESGKSYMKNVPLCSSNLIVKRLEIKNCFLHPTIMFRNEKWVRYRPKLLYVEDYDLYLNLLTHNKRLMNLDKILFKCRTSKGSIRHTKSAYQRLFQQKAKEFYIERLRTGKDSYVNFNPKTILKINPKTSSNRLVLEGNIKSNFMVGNYVIARQYMIKYFKLFGITNKFCIYYVASLFGQKFVNLIMSSLPQALLRRLNE